MIQRNWSFTCKTAMTLVICVLIGGCDKKTQEQTCKPVGENLLLDTEFATLKAPRTIRKWQSSEHAAGKSFVYTAKEGVLSIEQKGVEPWMTVSQSPTASALAGKTLEFSADLKMDLVPPKKSHNFKLGGGLTLFARANGKVVVDSSLEHEPNMGVHDWQRVSVIVTLPAKVNYLQVSFLHQAGGVLQVRQPSLRQLTGNCLKSNAAQ